MFKKETFLMSYDPSKLKNNKFFPISRKRILGILKKMTIGCNFHGKLKYI
jgi:hypothetical protein